jgi:hypothetical protein
MKKPESNKVKVADGKKKHGYSTKVMGIKNVKRQG